MGGIDLPGGGSDSCSHKVISISTTAGAVSAILTMHAHGLWFVCLTGLAL